MSEHNAGVEALRLAAEIVLSDEGLTADLADPEADLLLHWATTASQRTAAARLGPGQESDRDRVAEAVRPVRELTRAINNLVAEHQGLDEYTFLQRLLALVELAAHVEPAGGLVACEGDA